MLCPNELDFLRTCKATHFQVIAFFRVHTRKIETAEPGRGKDERERTHYGVVLEWG